MKKVFYIASFAFLGVLAGFMIHTLAEFAILSLLFRNFEKYNLGFSWQQWFDIHTFGTAALLVVGGIFGISQGFLWWRILYVEKRRFGHHGSAIVLDFDHTVFNTTKYVEALKEMFFEDFGIAKEMFVYHRNSVKACCEVIDMDEFIKRLPNENKKQMHRAHHQFIEDRAAEFVFPDAADFIKHHRKNFDIILLTHGDEELQREKIKHSALPRLSKIIVTQKPKEEALQELLQDYKKIHFIDDKAKVIDEVKTALSEIVSYFIVRSDDHPYGQTPPACQCSDHDATGLNFEVQES